MQVEEQKKEDGGNGGKPCPRPRPRRKNKPKTKNKLTAARVRRRVTPDDASRLTCARVTGRGGRIESLLGKPEGAEKSLSDLRFFFLSFPFARRSEQEVEEERERE